MGLVPLVRRKGIGLRLIQAAIAKALSKGLPRTELAVRVDNVDARALYDRVGFKAEGLNVRSFFVDAQYHDSHAIALLTS